MIVNKNGFSLVEAMVGLGIAGIMGVVLMGQQENASKIQSKINNNQVVNTAAQTIQTALANRAICSKSLEDLKMGDPVDQIYEATVNPTFTGDPSVSDEFVVPTPIVKIAFIGQELPGKVKIEDMRLVKFVKTGKEYLRVTFNTDPDKVKKQFGSAKIAKLFQLQTLKDGTPEQKITSCHSEQSNILNSALQQSCMSMGAFWDTSQNPPKCTLTNLPNCILSNEACRGVFNVNQGAWKIKTYVFDGRTCTMHYQKDGFYCTGSFDRTCTCATKGCTCNDNFGQVDCYRRDDRGCADNPEKEVMESVNRCCQSSAPVIPRGGFGGWGG